MITPGVGDFSDLVMSEGLGEVLEGESISQNLIESVLHNRDEFARRCTRGGQSLTWQAFRDPAKAVFG